jgi:hypothetical protein
MKETITIPFRDVYSNEESLLVVGDDGKNINICLSILSDGDIEVFMTTMDADKLIKALEKTIRRVNSNGLS